MILKILHWREEGLPADELVLEADSFLIQSIDVKQSIPCNSIYLPKHKECKPEGGFYSISHKDNCYIFQTAYLMNNNGKTIQKYG